MKSLSSLFRGRKGNGERERGELPTEVTIDNNKMPNEFWDAIYEYLQDAYGRDVGKFPASYGVELKISGIEWDDLEGGDM